MSNNKVKIIYKKYTKEFKKKGYINLNHKYVKGEGELVEIASIFRDPRYETLRMIYTKGKRIVGYESISSRIPNYVKIFTKDNTGRIKAERNFYKMENRMKRLKADGYYMVHNHPSGNAIASKNDLLTTEDFFRNLDGFKGHLIVNSGTYAWIDINERGFAYSKDNQKIVGYKKDKIDKLVKRNAIYDIKIKSRDDLVYLMHHIKNSKNYSIAIMVDSQNKPRMILDIPNEFLNMKEEQVNGYFKNLARINGVVKVFFLTESIDTYLKSLEHLKKGTFLDSIWYKEQGEKIYVCGAQNVIKNGNRTIFDEEEKECADISEEEEEYKQTEEKLRVLYKQVGKLPRVKIIENTLEAKQELVNGLIEVIPYNDMLLICNDEGKILDLPPNVIFDFDYIAGDCFVVGDDYKNGDFKSLTEEQIIKAKEDLTKRSFKYKSQHTKYRNDNNHGEIGR